MAVLQNLSDDQVAILGCCVALALSFGLMMVSYHFGQIVRGERLTDGVDGAAVSQSGHGTARSHEAARSHEDRRAA